jgi:hypothetical protein
MRSPVTVYWMNVCLVKHAPPVSAVKAWNIRLRCISVHWFRGHLPILPTYHDGYIFVLKKCKVKEKEVCILDNQMIINTS